MVTHNSELANKYANRIIRLHDGKIVSDTNPYVVDETQFQKAEHRNLGKTSMSFLTALALSFNNLRTKKGRTILTAFAGSIGIIGIALIMSLSKGVNNYIENIQKDTMSSYPITIEAQSFDLSSLIETGRTSANTAEVDHDLDAVYSNSKDLDLAQSAVTSLKRNNLTEFKKYLDDPNSPIHQYIGENGIVYSYNIRFDVYAYDPEGELINTDGSTFNAASSLYKMSNMGMESMNMSSSMKSYTSNYKELLPGKGENLISQAVIDNYNLLYGQWPQAYDEVVLVLDKNNEISSSVLFELGLLPASEYKDILDKIEKGEEVQLETHRFNYEDVCRQKFYLIPACDYYVKKEDGLFEYVGDNEDELVKLLEKSLKLKLVGVVSSVEDASYTPIIGGVGYTRALTDYIIDYTNASPVVKAQEATPDTNVLNGLAFEPKDDKTKVEDTIKYLSGLNVSDKAAFFTRIIKASSGMDPAKAEMLLSLSEVELAKMLEQYLLADPQEDILLMIYDNYISVGSYDENMKAFGLVSRDAPSAINIYADRFEDKDGISACIESYNQSAAQENQITYTDYIGLLMSSVTTIINVISYVLIAFVSVSLVVSSIMIGIITYISVLERTKEIGILRAIGASKRNISQVFNAETIIVGFISGILGIGITLLLFIPGNAIIHSLTGTTSVNAVLPVSNALMLIVLSVVLTLIAGIIPSRAAAKKDPVIALRSE